MKKIRRILNNLNELTTSENNAERAIAIFTRKNINRINEIKIKDLAEQTHTNFASVTRFFQKINLSGFKEFKDIFSIYKDLIINDEKGFALMKDVKKDISIFSLKYQNTLVKMSDNVYKITEKKAFKNMVHQLKECTDINIFAFSLSRDVVRAWSRRMNYLSYNVRMFDDYSQIKNHINNHIKETDLNLFLSLSGENKLILNTINNFEKIYNLKNNFLIRGTSKAEKMIFNNSEKTIILYSKESEFWDLLSITSQGFIQILDYIYLSLLLEKNE